LPTLPYPNDRLPSTLLNKAPSSAMHPIPFLDIRSEEEQSLEKAPEAVMSMKC